MKIVKHKFRKFFVSLKYIHSFIRSFIHFGSVPALTLHVFMVRGLGTGAAGPGYDAVPGSSIAVLDLH
jgi:hypothetical protein